MLWRWRWSYPVVVAILFVGSPSEPLEPIEGEVWIEPIVRKEGLVRIALIPDAGCMQIKDGKPMGYEYALLQAWADSCEQAVEWLYPYSAEQAYTWLEMGRADLIAGNLPKFGNPAFIATLPVREFNWVQFGASDSIRWLSEYPLAPELLNLVDSLPIWQAPYTMWRHLDPNQKGWVLPDCYLPGLPKIEPQAALCISGSFHWYLRIQDSTLLEELNHFLTSPRAKRIQAVQSRVHLNSNWLGISPISPYDAIFKESDWQDPYTLMALAFVESRFRSDVTSPAGAVGLMQLIPSTARRLGLDSAELFIPEKNILGGVKYLRFLDQYWEQRGVDTLERYPFILAAYNTGPSPIARAADQASEQGYDPTIWRDHVDQVAQGPGAHYAKKTMALSKVYSGYMWAIENADFRGPKTESK